MKDTAENAKIKIIKPRSDKGARPSGVEESNIYS